ncbi:MAG TPA: hypothetical protein DCZ69_00480 [Syntrophobacteraceae bacterium]|nr:hypothetical protein [Syntrophobacteraceae bacterium]HBZ56635.1 hypothetical protein [Syntrophobacteraceae bacterium]
MKISLLVLSVFASCITSAGFVYSDTSRIVNNANEYNGVTEEISYTYGDDQYNKGIYKIVEFYNAKKRIVRIESYYTDDHAMNDGIIKREQEYTNESIRTPRLREAEYYYNKEYSNRVGLSKSKEYYDGNGKRIKTEFSYTDSYAHKKNISRLDALYDASGNAYRHIYYGKDGKMISTEEKKEGEWKQVKP